MQRVAAAFLCLLLFMVPAFAQSASTIDITRAEYGSGNQWVDVTDRVRSLATDSSRFRVDDQTLGVYSQAPGDKVLRIDVRDRSGNSRQISFRQNEYADLSANVGGYGNDGNGRRWRQGNLQITSARYGSAYRTTDVTSLLNSKIQNGRLEFQVGSTEIGTDPAPNRNKTLTVHYTYNGRQAQAVFRDGEYVRLPLRDDDTTAGRRGYGRYGNSDLQITRAQYGSWNHTVDVTQRVNAQVQNGELHLQVSSRAMGTDPAPSQAKTLRVEYTLNGQRQQAVVRDGETLNLPEGTTTTSAYPGSYPGTRGQTVVCESNGSARNYCTADTRGGVRLTRQISSTSCREGSTWGYDNRGVWVSNGCRAEFQVGSAYSSTYGNGPSYGSGPSIVIPNGTQLAVRTNENIDSSQTSAGQKFSAVMTEDVRDGSGNIAIPRGSDVQLVIRQAEGSDLLLDIDSVAVGGQQYVVSTADLEQKGGSGIGANKRTATMVGGGAAVGAIIGAIVGGGKGAAIGAAVGAAGGAGAQVLTKGKQVKVPAETVLTFQLDSDLQLQQQAYRQ